MSKFMSHREMRAATRVLGDMGLRLHLLEEVVKLLLVERNLDVVVKQDGTVELVEKAPEAPQPEGEITGYRELPEEEPARG